MSFSAHSSNSINIELVSGFVGRILWLGLEDSDSWPDKLDFSFLPLFFSWLLIALCRNLQRKSFDFSLTAVLPSASLVLSLLCPLTLRLKLLLKDGSMVSTHTDLQVGSGVFALFWCLSVFSPKTKWPGRPVGGGSGGGDPAANWRFLHLKRDYRQPLSRPRPSLSWPNCGW